MSYDYLEYGAALARKLAARRRRRLALWALSGALGVLASEVWGTTAVLSALLAAALTTAALRNLGLRVLRRMVRWAFAQFWDQVRGVVVSSALGPTLWDAVKRLLGQPSSDSLLNVALLLLVLAATWVLFPRLARASVRATSRRYRR